jgi:type I restriction enzyme S subunit
VKLSPAIETRRLKFVATLNDETLSETTDPDHELKYIDIGNVDSFGRVHEIASYAFSKAPSRARRKVRDGDVIVSTVRTYLQAIAPISDPEDNLVVSTGFAVARPNRDLLDTEFFKYALREPRFLYEVEARSTGISYPAINSTELADIQIQLPLLSTQRRIAAYLDAETAQMDSLVAEKEQMLKLLEEKRAAQTSHAVIRGLNSRAPLKPSGLPWLGDIPEHWMVRRLKQVCRRIDTGGTPSASYMENTSEGNFQWFTPGDFTSSDWLDDSRRKIPVEAIQDGEAKVFPAQSLLVVGIGATLGKVALSPSECSANQQINVLFDWYDTDPRFVLAALRSCKDLLWAYSNSATLPILNQERLGSIEVPVPPLEEQRAIVAHLTAERERTAGLEAALQDSIELLRERRRALITAAVTGQIPAEAISV